MPIPIITDEPTNPTEKICINMFVGVLDIILLFWTGLNFIVVHFI